MRSKPLSDQISRFRSVLDQDLKSGDPLVQGWALIEIAIDRLSEGKKADLSEVERKRIARSHDDITVEMTRELSLTDDGLRMVIGVLGQFASRSVDYTGDTADRLRDVERDMKNPATQAYTQTVVSARKKAIGAGVSSMGSLGAAMTPIVYSAVQEGIPFATIARVILELVSLACKRSIDAEELLSADDDMIRMMSQRLGISEDIIRREINDKIRGWPF